MKFSLTFQFDTMEELTAFSAYVDEYYQGKASTATKEATNVENRRVHSENILHLPSRNDIR